MKMLGKIALKFLLIFITSYSFGQCKIFAKRKCIPSLQPYITNGQMNAAHLFPGEGAELNLNLNKGLSYRILICTDPILKNTIYRLTNQDNTLLFSDTMRQAVVYKDIKVERSQLLNLSIQTARTKNTIGIEQSGCVTILVGFK